MPRAEANARARASCVVLLPTREFGGHERMLLEWLAKAANRGLRLRIHAAGDERLARACESAALEAPVVSYPPRVNALRDAWITWRLLAGLPEDVAVLFAPGVLQVGTPHWLAAFLRRRTVAGYVPMAYSSRRMGFRGGALRDWAVRQAVRRVDLWITVSQEQQDLLTGDWRLSSPVFVVPNRLALLEQWPAQREATRVGRPLRALFAGRFDANQKGLDWLCGWLRARAERWLGHWRFTFQGQGTFRAELCRLAAELGEAHVQVVPWGDVAQAMKEADVLLLPSRFEGLPLVALEAVHHGLPVVASNTAGVSALLPPRCRFDFGDDEALWAALKAMEDPAARAAALAHGRARIQALLAPAAFHREIDRIVEVLALAGRNAGAEVAVS